MFTYLVSTRLILCVVTMCKKLTNHLVIFLAVPPKVIDEESSMDLVVKEGTDMLLQCKAQGYPEPYIMWRREDGLDINYNGNTGK